MMTIQEWREFLEKWSEEWITTDERFPAAVRKRRWLGFKPATGEQIEKLEKRLGYRLPPSYRTFLLTTNGWRRTSSFVERVRPVNKVEWLEVDDPQLLDALDIFSPDKHVEPFNGFTPEEYFSYDGRLMFDDRHLKQSLKIADPIAGDSAIYVLNPEVVTEDGEWEAWVHAHWIPGATRYPSFAHLMRAEYESFRSTVLNETKETKLIGPFSGVYAPDRPRHRATKTGPGKRRRPRLTVAQLIARLEDRSAKTRIDAADHLLRQFDRHDPDDERPELIEPLTRILCSQLEPDVRSAAAAMLGVYGDRRAVEALVAALDDVEVVTWVLYALGALEPYVKDTKMADALCKFLSSPKDTASTSKAMHILEDFRDSRLVPIALQVLDSDSDMDDLLRIQAALALTVVCETAADHLMARLTHQNPDIRATAAALVRETKDRRTIGPLRDLLRDSCANVRMQATWSLRFLGENVPISEADIAEAREETLAKIENRSAKARGE